ncbi:adhesion G-protein coupled receptor G5-like [Takifugu rubripes]|uniref:Adhesion G-protein coupled receptor G5-like n=1 Tax=Takifugu rubripes TaxID=31033 RepID=H2SB27_TAKRU|nr:adhesion G-protein coupled receptor G5-like [Takifugu rubripes]XP_029701881.1 adhesion G-protein coupled receptor G5-like [Takifugu rubripes]
MELQRLLVLTLSVLFSTASCENDWDFQFCGTWRHGGRPRTLGVNVSPGCNGIAVSANQSSLSIRGEITSQCRHSRVIPLTDTDELNSAESHFCLYWEPFYDQLKLQFGGKNLTLCPPASLHGSCCTDLSHDRNGPDGEYGIVDGRLKDDLVTDKTLLTYYFNASSTDCKDLCDQQSQKSTSATMVSGGRQATGTLDHPCARSSEVLMKEDFKGRNVTSPLTQDASAEPAITVQIPPVLKEAAKNTDKVVCTFFQNNSLFQDGAQNFRILDDVVEITVENEIIRNLPEPIRIDFRHDVITKSHSRTCVSWDTRKDPLQVHWSSEGCETHHRGSELTECLCNHLTYFSVLVQLQPGPVCHLLALSVITSLGCATSVISSFAVIVYICRKRHSKDQAIKIHLGLAFSHVFLNLLFFFTGVLANVGGASVCLWVAAGLHYALLMSLTWMGIEVFHTFWLVYKVFTPSPKPVVWNVVGFVAPAVPVVILVAVGDIYGKRELRHCDGTTDPYSMCWLKDNDRAWLAHYFTTMTILVALVSFGLVMLYFVFRQIRSREEWRQNRVAFLSMWGLSCLFGTTWVLAFLSFGPFTEFFMFLFCILNSFQGFFLMLRFCMLQWIRKQGGGSSLGSSSGSTRQHMLQAQ